ncbi:MAG: HAMP domain-containing protein [Deltaproteobacteria bacterium]|nr:HAMP domain-containing protein [Deltaproteobacteria bacterium]MBW2071229.1 HAMP domain-containing protein [Deltaproteobacteria bacterium]
MIFSREKDPSKETRRRKREGLIILATIPVIFFLTYLESHLFQFGSKLPLGSNILIFALMNVNVILLLLLLYLVTRNVVKLIFERKRNIFGHRVRTKLVIAFVALSIVPTVILFGLASQFISTSMEYWYNIQVEQSLKKSLEVSKRVYDDAIKHGFTAGKLVADQLGRRDHLFAAGGKQLSRLLEQFRPGQQLDCLAVYSTPSARVQAAALPDTTSFFTANQSLQTAIKGVFKTGEPVSQVISRSQGDLVCTLTPVFQQAQKNKIIALVLTGRLLPRDLVDTMAEISRGFENYQQMKMLKNPIKFSHLVMLSLVTLLILFSASWFGFYLAKSITVPIQRLAEGTRRIAGGDLNVHIDQDTDDEIGLLVNSFNRMALDLQASQRALQASNLELKRSSEEIERRRRYMEIVLRNVAAGVVSVNPDGRIQTVNESAESMFGLKAADVHNRHYSQILQGEQLDIVRQFIEMYKVSKQKTLQLQVRSVIGGRLRTLLVTTSILHDEEGQYLGVVVVFDDLTELEKAQRMAAWREVARRIAHEIKNPLTPIQLSAQRLRRKYLHRFAEDGKVFDECTRTIINQVDELKLLVNEFSSFARMPTANPAPTDLVDIVRESLSLYRESHPATHFHFDLLTAIPTMELDQEQMKRVMLNLLDNAVAVVGVGGEIRVTLSYDDILRVARLEVADNGPGISAEDKIRMFEPYFSTKEKGTGLGLAIVSNIIAEHHGFIRVRDNHPHGTIIVVELPGAEKRVAEHLAELA